MSASNETEAPRVLSDDKAHVAITGRVVIVTGAGQGIGAALCRRLRQDGARVVGCDLPQFTSTIEDIADLAVACDVTEAAQVEAMVATTVARFGRVDGLVANAGIVRIGSVEEAPWKDIEDVVRVNLYGVLHCFRAVLPVMRRQKFGRLIATTSRNAQLCKIGKVGYNASKAAVVSVTGTLARELGGTDILVNNLVPGPTATQMHTGPDGRAPDTSYPTVRMLLTLPTGGPSGQTFLDQKEIHILQPIDPRLRVLLDETLNGGAGVPKQPWAEPFHDTGHFPN